MSDELIPMFKDGQTLDVNPVCVGEHKQLGWAVIPEVSVEPTAEKKTDGKKKGKSDAADSVEPTADSAEEAKG